MDLRKSILHKSVLGESSLNVSNISAYDSVADDTDNSIYYSFTSDSSKLLNDSVTSSLNSSITSDGDKENTTIIAVGDSPESKVTQKKQLEGTPEGKSARQSVPAEKISELNEAKATTQDPALFCGSDETPSALIDALVGSLSDNVHTEQATTECTLNKNVSEAEATNEIAEAVTTYNLFEENLAAEARHDTGDAHAIDPQPKLTLSEEKGTQYEELAAAIAGKITSQDVEMEKKCDEMNSSDFNFIEKDPNENRINPFTVPVIEVVPPSPVKEESKPSNVVEKRVIRRSVLAARVPANRFYSPVMRKSLDRKAKAVGKIQLARRTLYGTAVSMQAKAGPSIKQTLARPSNKQAQAGPSMSSGSRTPTNIPKPIATVKARTYKCPTTACNVEFSTFPALQEHQKMHKAPVPSSSHNCKWCDKKFQVENALLSHHIDKCVKIPVNEKRKLLASHENKEKARRRTTLFAMPLPKKRRSTARRPAPDATNKSGVLITPKRALKCHVCQASVPDAISLANHVVAHKFNRSNVAAAAVNDEA